MAREDFYASLFGRVYSRYMEYPAVSRVISALAWGGRLGPYYEAMRAIGEVPDGGRVVDCPCGAGVAFRALSPEQDVAYVAVDLSPSMLDRARHRAARRGLPRIDFVRADASHLPCADSSSDLYLSLWGLHCYESPARALGEAARVLRPNGRLVAATFVAGTDSLRQRVMIRPHRGDFGPVLTATEVQEVLTRQGFDLVQVVRSGPMLYLDCRLRGEI